MLDSWKDYFLASVWWLRTNANISSLSGLSPYCGSSHLSPRVSPSKGAPWEPLLGLGRKNRKQGPQPQQTSAWESSQSLWWSTVIRPSACCPPDSDPSCHPKPETWASSICLMVPRGCQEAIPLLTTPAPAEAAFALGSSPHPRAYRRLYSKPGQTLSENTRHTQLLLWTSPFYTNISTQPHSLPQDHSIPPGEGSRQSQCLPTLPHSPIPLPLTHSSIPK